MFLSNSLFAALPALVVVLPLIGGLILALLNTLTKGSSVLIRLLYLAICVINFAIVGCFIYYVLTIKDSFLVYNFGDWFAYIGIAFVINFHSAAMVFLVAIGFLVTLPAFLKEDITSNAQVIFASLIMSGMNGLLLSVDLFNIYVFLELSSIAIYVMLSTNQGHNIQRSVYKMTLDYIIISSIAGVFVLLGILCIYVATGSLSMLHIVDVLNSNNGFLNGLTLGGGEKAIKLLGYGYVFLVVGFLIKCGFYPLYTWVVKSYVVGNSGVIALISAVISKVYIFLIYKVTSMFLSNNITAVFVHRVGITLCIIAFVGMVVMGLLNAMERHLRKEMAISSMIQVCYFIIGVFSFNYNVLQGVLLQMLGHTICIGAMFLIMEPQFYGDVVVNAIDEHRLSKKLVVKYTINKKTLNKIAFLLLLLNTAGYPFTLGFMAKWVFISSEGAIGLNTGMIIVGSLIGMLYTWRIVLRVITFNATQHFEKMDSIIKEVHAWNPLKYLMFTCACLVVGLGLLVSVLPTTLFSKSSLQSSKTFSQKSYSFFNNFLNPTTPGALYDKTYTN